MRMDMKRLLLLFSLCFSAVSLTAQDFRPIFEEGKVWDYEWWPYSSLWNPDWVPKHVIQRVEGDTVIGDKVCKKLYEWSDIGSSPRDELIASFYEENGKVYRIDNGTTDACLIYDFTVEVGDTVIIYDYNAPEPNRQDRFFSVTIKDVQTVEIQGQERKCIYVTHTYDYMESETVWIEGVGSDWGPVLNLGTQNSGNALIYKFCNLDGKRLFSVDVDNPAGIGEIIRDADGLTSKDNAVYDLSGRRLNEKPTKGLYVQGGKVYMAR